MKKGEDTKAAAESTNFRVDVPLRRQTFGIPVMCLVAGFALPPAPLLRQYLG